MSTFYVASNVINNYRFTFKSEDGKKLLHGAGFYSKAACLQGIAHVKSCVDDPECFLRKGGEGKRHYFLLQSDKGKSLAVSEMYNTSTEMETVIDIIRKQAVSAHIKDEK